MKVVQLLALERAGAVYKALGVQIRRQTELAVAVEQVNGVNARRGNEVDVARISATEIHGCLLLFVQYGGFF